MAKRSPILGYNHNVRYRGLVFHVQTEDSGLRAPHLFTHLFHAGVIVSTRKYVYDAGATEEAIKSLMQAQHKAVMKELRRGLFDDKIDQYLGETPGLLPRGSAGGEDAGASDAAPAADAIGTAETAPVAVSGESVPVATPAVGTAPVAAPAARPAAAPAARPAATEAERAAAVSLAALAAASVSDEDIDDPLAATTLTDPIALGREPTLEEPAIALRPTELAVDPRLSARTTTDDDTLPQPRPRASTEGEAPALAPPPQVRPYTADELYATMRDSPADSQPEITIQLEVDDSDELPPQRPGRRREPRDTETNPWEQTRLDPAMPFSDGIPGAVSAAASVTPTVRNADATGPISTAVLSERAAKAVGAASLPPARPIARPASRPAMTPPPGGRPPSSEDRRTPVPGPPPSATPPPPPAEERRTPVPPSDATEPYAAAPGAELPGTPPERPGQYSQHKKISARITPETPRDGARPAHPQGLIPQAARPGSPPHIPQQARLTPPPVAPRTVPSPIPAPARTVTPPPVAGPRLTPVPSPVPIPVPRQASQPVVMPQLVPMPQPSAAAPQGQVPPARPSTPTPTPVPQAPVPQAPVPQAGRPIAPMPVSRSTPVTIPMVRPVGEPAPAQAPVRPRTLTPQRVSMSPASPAGAPPGVAPGRSGTSGANSGVVMSRPAVIVGAPAKTTGPNQRVRKAREDEGRTFGQGLISEKSLDEVILAYLSEDAEDK